MKTQEELWAEYERLKEAEDWEAALKLLDLIEPVSDEEWLRAWADAAEVDEPIPQFIRDRIASFEAAQGAGGRRAG